MNQTKRITLTGYEVKFIDLREPKPRHICTEVYTLDQAGADALQLLGMNVTDFITARYERGGYHVTSVERIKAKRIAIVDLRQLWEEAQSQQVQSTPISEEQEGVA